MFGILGYGAFIPYTRIKVEEIHAVWRNTSVAKIKKHLMVDERAVLQPNEDTITMAVAAAKDALAHAGLAPSEVGALFLGTCTNPYDSRPSTTTIVEALGTPYNFIGGDVQFSGKSGTTAMQLCMALVKSGMVQVGLAIGSDTINRHICPGKAYEYTASAGAAAFLLGEGNVIAEIEGTTSYASEMTDFFRVEGDRYIQNIGNGGDPYPAFEVGFVEHVVQASESLLARLNKRPADYDYAVFQQPYGFMPYAVGERLGFTKAQVAPGVIAQAIGDTGSASSLLGLIHVLDQAKAGDRIFLASYGWGAGSDAFSLVVTPELEKRRPAALLAHSLYENKNLVDYGTATRLEYKYAQDTSPLYI
jgi:2-acetylphloroglucinol acetyltransferase